MDQATKDKVIDQLRQHPRLVITAPPGAGKSTLLPLALLEAIDQGRLPEGKILLLEPRRLAARQIAERMSDLLGEPIGGRIGYRVRFENRVSAATRLEVLTEGILTRMLVSDPTLEGVSIVLFDEFHERSLTSDVALTLTREAQQIIRPDLRIALMSATIDTSGICQALDAPLVESSGQQYPVELQRTDLETVPLIRRCHQEHEGDILVFLPGEAEIRRCQETLGESLSPTRVLPLYGMLSPQEQREAIAPSQPGQRKVVLATPIAETSLTIQGVRVVIDSGLCRRMVFNPQTSLSHLETVQISMDMAIQRMGRAGRVAPGVCYRMWSIATEHRMETCRTPEILEADLAPMLLDIAAWGSSSIESLPWLTPPPAAHVAQGRRLLQWLGAIDDQGRITPHGQRLAALPCHPRIAQMLVMAENPAEQALACDLAALLEERDPLASSPQADADIRSRLPHMTRRIRQVADQYRRLVHLGDVRPQGDAGLLLAYAYPERIARIADEGCGRFLLASGERARIDEQDELSAHDWIVAVSLHAQPGGMGRIHLAAPVDAKLLAPLTRCKENVSWDSRRGCIVAQREHRIGQLVLRTEPIRSGDSAQLIAQAAVRDGRSMLDFREEVLHLQRRVAAVASWHPELNLPDLSTEVVLQSAPEWLPLYVGKATTVNELKKIDLCSCLWGLLTYEQQLTVDRLAPEHVHLPSGRRAKVEYRQGAELPIVRVRLQECFGMADTPRLDDGRQPVLMELLSPGFKPVQLTQDLRHFWEETYTEVRKELRRRYPKHAWPDNPASFIE